MPAQLLLGEPLAEKIKGELKKELEYLRKEGLQPRVAAIHNKESSAARVYRRMQKGFCDQIGIPYETREIDSSISESALCQMVEELNRNQKVTGISIHLPLPESIDTQKVLRTVTPSKDIEGTHPFNLGMLAFTTDYSPAPCAASAAVEILKSVKPSLKGLDVTIVGRSPLVGKAIALMVLQSKLEAPTPTICHTATHDLESHTRCADVLFAAAGRANLIRGTMIKKGAIVIDIGINKVGDKIVGDVSFEEAKEMCSYLTPVPGGVGPITHAILLKNIVACAKAQL